jgi:hypothetical protein
MSPDAAELDEDETVRKADLIASLRAQEAILRTRHFGVNGMMFAIGGAAALGLQRLLDPPLVVVALALTATGFAGLAIALGGPRLVKSEVRG